MNLYAGSARRPEQVLLAITVLCSEPDVFEDAKEFHLERPIRRLRSLLK
jgi:hypothetical protein